MCCLYGDFMLFLFFNRYSGDDTLRVVMTHEDWILNTKFIKELRNWNIIEKGILMLLVEMITLENIQSQNWRFISP